MSRTMFLVLGVVVLAGGMLLWRSLLPRKLTYNNYFHPDEPSERLVIEVTGVKRLESSSNDVTGSASSVGPPIDLVISGRTLPGGGRVSIDANQKMLSETLSKGVVLGALLIPDGKTIYHLQVYPSGSGPPSDWVRGI